MRQRLLPVYTFLRRQRFLCRWTGQPEPAFVRPWVVLICINVSRGCSANTYLRQRAERQGWSIYWWTPWMFAEPLMMVLLPIAMTTEWSAHSFRASQDRAICLVALH
jgi:hypothetical protein